MKKPFSSLFDRPLLGYFSGHIFRAPTLFLATACLIYASCSKGSSTKDSTVPERALGGQIYHQYASQVQRIDAGSWKQSLSFSYNAYSTVGWSMSRDGKLRLMSTREPGTYDRNRFTIVNSIDGKIIHQFDFVPRFGNSTRNVGAISPDNSLVLIGPDNDNGIVIVSMDGKVKHELTGIGENNFTGEDQVFWLPGNHLLVKFQNRYLLRSAPPYTSLDLIKEMDYEKWGGIRTSNDGKKISMYINRHIHVLDIPGKNLFQVTDGESEEVFAEFSPDDKYLLVGADYFHAPASMNSHWYLKVVPADGKKYNMDSSPEVIEVVPEGQSGPVRANGVTLWRP